MFTTVKIRLVLLFAFFCLSSAAFAQKITLSGYLIDAATGEALIGASVYLPEAKTGAVSNAYGFYSVSVDPAEKVKIVYSYLGYTTEEKELSLTGNTTLSVKLKAAAEALKEVQVSASKSAQREEITSAQMSTIKITPSQIKNIPSLGGEVDIIKVAQLLPGVKRGGEGQTGMYVRGGGADQNLILLDEAPVYNVSHLFGFFSIFNNDAIKEVTLLKGCFPATYGGRASSVMDIRMQEGNTEKYHAQGGIGLLSSRLTVQGPIPVGKKKLSFLVSGRRSYIDKVLGVVKKDIPYYFYDANVKLNYQHSETDRFYFSSYYGNDVLSEPKGAGAENAIDFGFTLGNFTNTLRWNHQYSGKLFSNLTLIHTRFKYNVNGKFGDNSLHIGSFIEDAGFKLDYDYFLNARNQIRFGGTLTKHFFRPNIVAAQGELTEALKSQPGSLIAPQEMAVYAQNDFKATDKLTINYGMRLSGFAAPNKVYTGLEPRLSAAYQLSESSSIKAGYSRMNQYLHLVSSSSVSLPTDLWYPVTENVKPQIADQLTLGYTKRFEKIGSTLNIEGYYKKLSNLIEYKEGAVLLLNDNYESELLSGKGAAYGGEIFLQKTEGRLNGWVGYSLSWATRQFDGLNNGKQFFAKYDRRHDLSVVVNYKLSERLSVSGVWVYATGQRLTGRIGQYTVAKPSGSGVEVLPIYTDRNALKFSPSHRLDLNIVLKNKPTRKWESEWHFGAYNVYNQTQPYKVKVESNGRGGYKYSQVGLFGFIPSIAYNFKF